jgi:hypothetical protein
MEKLAQAGDGSRSVRFSVLEGALQERMGSQGAAELREPFLEKFALEIDRNGKNYITVVQSLAPEASGLGTAWLQGIVDEASGAAWAALK